MYSCIYKKGDMTLFKAKLGLGKFERFSVDISRWIVQMHLTFDVCIALFRFTAVY